jgi:hypothetical protein
MCENAFYNFPDAVDAAACADLCVADKKCVMFAWDLDPGKPQCRLSATCTEPTNCLPGYQGYFRNSTTAACAADAGEVWTRVFLTDAAAKGAVCIDGSPG